MKQQLVASLRTARVWMDHGSTCNYMRHGDGKCNCGMLKARDDIDEVLKNADSKEDRDI